MLSKTRFQALSAFTRKKERTESGLFFVDGWRWLEEALALDEPPECVLATREAVRTDEEAALLARARAVAREFHEATEAQLARLTGAVSAAGVAALVRWKPASLEALAGASSVPLPDSALVVALDAVRDPGNAGTIIRTADWFGARGVVFGEESVEPTNPKLVRSTMGSLLHLSVVEVDSLVGTFAKLRASGFVTVGAALDGVALSDFTWPDRAVLVVGNEAGGIRPEVRDALDAAVCIPRFGRAESLNAAVAAAVLMADWRRT